MHILGLDRLFCSGPPEWQSMHTYNARMIRRQHHKCSRVSARLPTHQQGIPAGTSSAALSAATACVTHRVFLSPASFRDIHIQCSCQIGTPAFYTSMYRYMHCRARGEQQARQLEKLTCNLSCCTTLSISCCTAAASPAACLLCMACTASRRLQFCALQGSSCNPDWLKPAAFSWQ